MNILVTGAAGFVGKNLVAALSNIKDGKDRTRPDLCVDEIFSYDIGSTAEDLQAACERADFVFHLAGVNRPQNEAEFQSGNVDLTAQLLQNLRDADNRCPIMLSSSLQATLMGRYAGGAYGKSKKAGEDLLFSYGAERGSDVYVYRFPNLFGKWCRPNYNSAVATFCHNIARGEPITVNDPAVELELLYIDDLVEELLSLLQGAPHRCRYDGLTPVADENGAFCHVPTTHHITLGDIVALLRGFADQPRTLQLPEMAAGSFAKKLYATFLSYLPADRVAFPLKMNCDARGSFTELLKFPNCGQVSVNISKPGITKGQHWHHTKWEFFIVVAGHGLIQQRRIGGGEVLEFEVSGEQITAVHMLPGYTHNIINLSDTEDLVTVMWANEPFDAAHPDTFFEPV